MKLSALLLNLLLLLAAYADAAPYGDCEGTPEEAIVELPEPLKGWGEILCTPYGHIITNKEGWVWTYIGGYYPFMIPSQIVSMNPDPVGNASYFKRIDMTRLTGEEAETSIKKFEDGFLQSEDMPKAYLLEAVSISNKKLPFKFFVYKGEYGDDLVFGMWCSKGCNPETRFIILDRSKSEKYNADESTPP